MGENLPGKLECDEMERVAHFLQTQALKQPGAIEKDLFGRSSYNRYYYAVFLCVREMMAELRSEWAELPHADYPKTLRGEVKRVLDKGRQEAARARDAELVEQCNRSIAAASELARLMVAGSATRVAADYHPEILVEFISSGRFRLNSVEITQAHEWLGRARVLVKTIARTWAQLQ